MRGPHFLVAGILFSLFGALGCAQGVGDRCVQDSDCSSGLCMVMSVQGGICLANNSAGTGGTLGAGGSRDAGGAAGGGASGAAGQDAATDALLGLGGAGGQAGSSAGGGAGGAATDAAADH